MRLRQILFGAFIALWFGGAALASPTPVALGDVSIDYMKKGHKWKGHGFHKVKFKRPKFHRRHFYRARYHRPRY
jgi:hypothetical protein